MKKFRFILPVLLAFAVAVTGCTNSDNSGSNEGTTSQDTTTRDTTKAGYDDSKPPQTSSEF